jgi:hypothetical protein
MRPGSGLLPWALLAGVACGSASADSFDAATELPAARATHSATLLADGRVLLAGGCLEDGCGGKMAGDAWFFDTANGRYAPAGTMVLARAGHRAVALPDGSVLLIGGWSDAGATDIVERFDPERGSFSPHGRLVTARDAFTATLLRDGRILVIGGYAGSDMRSLASAELYDPATGTSQPTGELATARRSHSATLLPDGGVLVAGGSDTRRSVTATLERYDPQTGSFFAAGTLGKARHKHAAVLVGGEVLLLGGAAIPESDGAFTETERWNPGTGEVAAGPRMAEGRYKFLDAVLVLPDGDVLVAGGGARAERLDRDLGRFIPVSDAPGAALAFSTATALGDGRVLVAGGYDSDIRVRRSAWIYSPRGVATRP